MNRLLTALLLLAPFAVQAADHTATHRATVTATDAAHYSFANLVGEVHVTAHDGADIVIEATVTAESAALAEQVGIARDGNELWMDYPVKSTGAIATPNAAAARRRPIAGPVSRSPTVASGLRPWFTSRCRVAPIWRCTWRPVR